MQTNTLEVIEINKTQHDIFITGGIKRKRIASITVRKVEGKAQRVLTHQFGSLGYKNNIVVENKEQALKAINNILTSLYKTLFVEGV